MIFEDRYYQTDGINAGLKTDNGIIVMPTGSGKSHVCAGLVDGADGASLVLQPSKEILESNYDKASKTGLQAAIYSASLNKKQVGHITYATIGSIIKCLDKFSHVRNLIIDECHLVNAKGGMYEALIKELNIEKIIGMTATPYRLQSNSYGSHMKLLHRTRPKIFKEISYFINPRELVGKGYLQEPIFEKFDSDDSMLCPNSTGAEFSDQSIRQFIHKNDIVKSAIDVVKNITHNHILVFAESVESSQRIVSKLNQACISATEINAKTLKKDRTRNLASFEDGSVKAMVNVGTLTTGYDFPALDGLVDARVTMSAALHYQKIGRIVRPYPGKYSVVYDLCGNIDRLGNPLNYTMEKNSTGMYEVYGEKGRITTRAMDEHGECETIIDFGKHRGKRLSEIDGGYLEWASNELKGEKKHMFFSELKRRELFVNA